MAYTVNETLEYVISLTSHIRRGNIAGATLNLLVDMGFQVHMEGVGYLRKAILLRCSNPDMRLSAIYQEIIKSLDSKISVNQVEQAIVNAIEAAWKNRDEKIWGYFFYGALAKSKPSNKVFIARIACFMELWCDCC